MSDPNSAKTESVLRISGTVGSNRVMEAELLRLVMRSPFRVQVPKPTRQGSMALRYPFDPAVAWVAAHPDVTAPIIGARSLEQLGPSLDSLGIDMTPELRAEISALSRTPAPATDRLEEQSRRAH